MTDPAFPGRSGGIAQDPVDPDPRVELQLVEKIEKDVEARGASAAVLVLAIEGALTSRSDL